MGDYEAATRLVRISQRRPGAAETVQLFAGMGSVQMVVCETANLTLVGLLVGLLVKLVQKVQRLLVVLLVERHLYLLAQGPPAFPFGVQRAPERNALAQEAFAQEALAHGTLAHCAHDAWRRLLLDGGRGQGPKWAENQQ